MKNYYLFLFVIINLNIACRNGKCGDQSDENIYYNIPDSNKIQIPYHGNDTLIFVSEAGDTATLIGQGKKQFYEKQTASIGYADCPKSKITNYDNIKFEFIDKNKSNFLNLNFNSYPVVSTNSSYIGTSLKIQLSNKLEIINAGFAYMNYRQVIATINGKDILGCYLGDNNDYFYSFQYGILKFKDFKSIDWFLIKK